MITNLEHAVDLHVHSNCSDGSYTPTELVNYAIEKGLKAFALTDHDTIDGLDEALKASENTSVRVIPGIEFSTEYMKKDIHIVGLFIDYHSTAFVDYLQNFKESRYTRNQKLCSSLREKANIDITYEELIDMFPNAVITRAHYARFLLDKGYVRCMSEAFDRYLGDHTPYFIPREKVTPEFAIKLILEAGGIPVLAHPTLYHLGKVELDKLVAKLAAAGLKAIEGIYSTYEPRETKAMHALAEKYNLMISGGSDFHGTNKPNLDLAVGYGKLFVPEKILDTLEESLCKTKIIFTDMDGTLFNSKKEISPLTYQKILDLTNAGHKFVISSGRSLENLIHVREELQLPEKNVYISAYNGAALYDCEHKQLLSEERVSLSTAIELYQIALSEGLYCQTYNDTHIIAPTCSKELEFYTSKIKQESIITEDLSSQLVTGPHKLLVINLDDHEKLKAFRQKIMNSTLYNNLDSSFSNARYLEFYSNKAGKGNGLRRLCEHLHIPISNSIACGDEENDLSMILAAGVGVGMQNGSALVHQHADYVTTADNNHDGIAEVIDKFILK